MRLQYQSCCLKNQKDPFPILALLSMHWLEIVLWGVYGGAVFTLEIYSFILCLKTAAFIWLPPKALSIPLKTTPSVKATLLLLSLCSYHVTLSKTINCIHIPEIHYLRILVLNPTDAKVYYRWEADPLCPRITGRYRLSRSAYL